MAGMTANLKRQEAVTKRFQNELLAQTSWCHAKTYHPTEVEANILGDFQLTGTPSGGAVSPPFELRPEPIQPKSDQLQCDSHEQPSWLASLVEREGEKQRSLFCDG